MGVKLHGEKQFKQALKRFAAEAEQEAKKANLATGFVILTDTRLSLRNQKAIDTGGLTSSYHLESYGEAGSKEYWENPGKRGSGNYTSEDGFTNPGWLHAPIRGKNDVLVGSSAPHAAVTEFGRRAGARMPPPNALKPWLRRHGLPEGMAYPLARKIARRGIPARPSLWPAVEKARAVHQKLQTDGLQIAVKKVER